MRRFLNFVDDVTALGFRRRTAATILSLNLASVIFESFGLGMLLPVFQLIQADGDAAALAAQSGAWKWLLEAYATIGLEVTVPVLLITSMLAILGRQIFIYVRALYATSATLAFTQNLRDRAFRGYIRARLDYVQVDQQGHIINDLTTESGRAAQCVMGMIGLGGYIILGFIYLCLLTILSFPMTAIAVGVMVVASLPVVRLMQLSTAVSHEIVAANRGLVDFLVQRVKSLRLVRLSGTEAAEHAELARRTRRLYDHTYKSNILLARVKLFIEPTVAASGFAMLYFGVSRLGVSLEQIGLFLIILLRLLPVLIEAMHSRQQVLVTSHSLRVIRDRLKILEQEREEPGGERVFRALEKGVTLEHVSFAYEGTERTALRDVNATFVAHEMTALVGPSGSGKSTLIDLLPRLREPQRGRLLFDEVPADEFRLESLRAGLAYAPQQPQLFDVTVAEHIGYGRPGASRDEIQRAARLAGAHEFIVELSDGYDTRIGEDGELLSGGQRQRLDLARTLLKGAPLLILDEPTSHLDADAEDRFRQALQRIRAETKMTIVVVAHRLSTIALADRIVVLVDGRVEQIGTHGELIAAGGWYANAYRSQKEANDVDTATIPA